MNRSRSLLLILMVLAAAALQACSGGGGGSSTTTGAAQVSLTDAPGDYDDVVIMVKSLWFHTNKDADPRATDWVKFPLAAPMQVDLIGLSNGNMQKLWDGIRLPVETYRQIRVELAPTFDPVTLAGPNNYVAIGGKTYPLYVPDAEHGIKLVGTFDVSGNGTLRLAVDFDAGEDIVEFHEGVDYVMKPRLKFFDLGRVGAIIGKLSTGGSITASRFVIKAERFATAEEMLDTGATASFHVVRRWTVPKADGTFALYPVSTAVTGTWDIVIRGLDTQTMIVRGVPVTDDTTTMTVPTDLGTISTTPAANPDYAVAGAITSPTGGWVQFYQTLPGAGESPYEIRFRHFNPLSGAFKQTFMLNNDQIRVGSFVSSGATITFSPVIPTQGTGGYDAVAGAILFDRSAAMTVTSATTTVTFPTPLTVMSPYQGNKVTGSIVMGNTMKMNNAMDKGLLFAVHGGMIVNTIDVSSQMTGMGSGVYSLTNLPGGSLTKPLPGAFYGIEAVGWSTSTPSHKAIAIPQIVDLRTGDDTANMFMLPLWP